MAAAGDEACRSDVPRSGLRGARAERPVDAPGSGVAAALLSAFRLLDGRDRLRLALLAALLPISALGEMAAVAAMLPFLGALTAPESLHAIPSSGLWLARLGALQREGLVPLLGVVACLVLVATNTLIVVSNWLMLRFSSLLHQRIATTLLGCYLQRPYADFLSQNSASLASNLIVQAAQVTDGFVVPVLTAFGRGTAALTLLIFLGTTEPLLALVALGLIGGIYSVFYVWLARRKLRDVGIRRVRLNDARTQLISEAFGGIKDIKLSSAEQVFVDAYRPLARALSRDQAAALLIAVAPRYVVEAVAFGTVVLVALVAGGSASGHDRLVPLLGMFAFAGYRLMPAVQHVFASAVQIRSNLPAFERLAADVHAQRRAEAALGPARVSDAMSAAASEAALAPTRSIELRDVGFRYPGAELRALDGFNLLLNAKATTGIVGPTGSGKTTVLDLLLGLLRPEQGALLVDGVPLEAAELPRWQRALGYVPQHIHLSDTSVARNVAFGVPESEIDRARVERACRIAMLHDFITRALPDGYDTRVGERGVRLSGGERQRIGIARALYRCPDVLVLDEATSALDPATEAEVMHALRQLAGQTTIIMVAHRESTLRECDVIYRITHGRVELVGSHADLMSSEPKPPRRAGSVPERDASLPRETPCRPSISKTA